MKKIKEIINNKLTEKKQYVVCICKKGLFRIAVTTTLSLLDDSNIELNAVHGDYAVLILKMDIEQKTAIELALRDYLISIECNEEHTGFNSMVYK